MQPYEKIVVLFDTGKVKWVRCGSVKLRGRFGEQAGEGCSIYSWGEKRRIVT